MTGHAVENPRWRTVLDGVLVVLVILLVAGRVQAARSQVERPPQAAVYVEAAPVPQDEPARPEPAAISDELAAALIAAENAALGIPQFLMDLPALQR